MGGGVIADVIYGWCPSLAVDVSVGGVAAQHRVQRPRAAPAGEAFLEAGEKQLMKCKCS